MISLSFSRRLWCLSGLICVLSVALPLSAQTEKHSRRYKPLAPAAKVSVVVEKASNGKPISNAGVVFRASRNGKDTGSLEIKTDPDGVAMLDIIEVGSHVKVQVIADGYATNAAEFDVTSDEKSIVLKMEKPKAQVSVYEDNDGKASARKAGVQEPAHVVAPKAKAGTMPQAKSTTAPAAVAPAASPEMAPPAAAPASAPK